MKLIRIFAVALVLILAFGTTVMADSEITVSGNGEALVPADTAIISLGVSAVNADVLKAQATVNEAIDSIRSALLEDGIPKEDINTGYINIYAMYDYQNDQEELTSYNANSTLAIRTTEMERVGEIIDIAFGAGANTLNGISFSAKDTEEAEKEALKQAVEDAKGKAEILAEASGLRITGIESINEGGTYSFDRGVENNFAMKEMETAAADVAGTYVQSAKLTVTANITITYSTDD